MPPPIVLAFVILLGWPLVQLGSVLLVRSRRARLKLLAAELRADPRYGPKDHEYLDCMLDEARGDAFFILFPLALPLLLVQASWAELRGQIKPVNERQLASIRAQFQTVERTFETLGIEPRWKLPIAQDPRFKELSAIAPDIAFMRWPITMCLAALTSLIAAPIWLLAYGLRTSWTAFVAAIARRFAHSMRVAQGRA
jgi:hypothetical protein